MRDLLSFVDALKKELREREEQLVEGCTAGRKTWEDYQKVVGQISENRRTSQVIADLLKSDEEENDG
jgi:hypothetical protein